jgi:GntR family transcriptional repressor for pyruvate dehydrogenase complex
MKQRAKKETAFTPVHKANLADDVFTQLLSSILKGDFETGDRLPPERALAKDFSVNRSSVREAIRKLSHLGLIETKQGDGSRVLDLSTNAGLDILRYLFTATREPGVKVIADIMEIRRIFLCNVAGLAAQRSESDDLIRLRELLSQMKSAASKTELLQRLEWEFFEQVTRSAKNEVFLLLLNSFRPIFVENLDFFSTMMLATDEMVLTFQRIVNAIENGDDALSVSLVEHYLRRGEGVFLELFGEEKR